MNKQDMDRIPDELSAFLDGEAADSNATSRLIASDAGAAKTFAALQRMSAEMRALPAPNVREDFESRVMAQVRGENLLRARSARRWVVAASWGVAAAVCVGVAFLLLNTPGEDTPGYDGQAAQVLELRDQLDHALLAEWNGDSPDAELSGDWIDPNDTSSDSISNVSVDQNYADVVATFAAIATEDVAFEDDSDVYAVMEELTDDERNALRSLLTDYGEGGSQLL